MWIDLNSDLGESFGKYVLGNDEAIIDLVSSINIACGWHAGDPSVMAKTVKLAMAKGVAIGAHPGFMDLQGFGRRPMVLSSEELKNAIKYQLGALTAFVKAEGGKVSHLKPHGAMYNMAAKDRKMANSIVEAIYEVDPEIKLLALSGSQMIEAAKQIGLESISEAFADRHYHEDGSLVPRTEASAKISTVEQAVKQVLSIAKYGQIESVSGKIIATDAKSICVHGDTENAVEIVRTIKKALIENGVQIKGLGK